MAEVETTTGADKTSREAGKGWLAAAGIVAAAAVGILVYGWWNHHIRGTLSLEGYAAVSQAIVAAVVVFVSAATINKLEQQNIKTDIQIEKTQEQIAVSQRQVEVAERQVQSSNQQMTVLREQLQLIQQQLSLETSHMLYAAISRGDNGFKLYIYNLSKGIIFLKDVWLEVPELSIEERFGDWHPVIQSGGFVEDSIDFFDAPPLHEEVQEYLENYIPREVSKYDSEAKLLPESHWPTSIPPQDPFLGVILNVAYVYSGAGERVMIKEYKLAINVTDFDIEIASEKYEILLIPL
ncbi:hypothetical protein [Deinococcus deserti]|uniref:Uncharacterized protein n=1 Tax=Deinococcus deserti (strain DSM 17065 / CIP 109153 / LMG 22923 / VCD115) TaxID=546414 RepID=C1CX51_DEIDV|nr:hypothetical protein [Deinococcus deserti]ACO46768.2 Hypothetical protein Deide_17829 [Deinococcus deserti VCD115]